MSSSHPPLQTTPDQTAGLLLVARRFAEAHGLPRSSVEQILAVTRASRESALEIEAALEELEQSLRPCGRAPEVDDRGRIKRADPRGALLRDAEPACTRRTARGRHAALNAIVDAFAIFSGKRTAGTLPDGVDARYLLGIVRNPPPSPRGRAHHRGADPLAAVGS